MTDPGFCDALDRIYLTAPCQVLPNALWKTHQAIATGMYDCTLTQEGGQPVKLAARSNSELALFWTRDRDARLPLAMFDGASLAVMHQDYVSADVGQRFDEQERYFRLIHTGAPLSDSGLPPDFSFAPVAIPGDVAAVSNLIGRCYDDLKPKPETVACWTRHSVFSSDLWVWVIRCTTGEPVALGIAELDTRIGEGSLEWVQVLPAYRGCRIGSALVHELLRRLASWADFVTVSGRVDNASAPEALYRRCGFAGDDVWWVFRRA